MKKFSDLRVGDTFFSTCSISDKELEEYLKFSRVRNAFLEDKQKGDQLVSGRAILSRMEGELIKLNGLIKYTGTLETVDAVDSTELPIFSYVKSLSTTRLDCIF